MIITYRSILWMKLISLMVRIELLNECRKVSPTWNHNCLQTIWIESAQYESSKYDTYPIQSN